MGEKFFYEKEVIKDMREFERLKFEYQELREERKRNTYISYALMSILIGASLLLFKDGVTGKAVCPLVAGFISIGLVFIAWLIDRKLTYFNNIRREIMMTIEERLETYNLLLTEENLAPPVRLGRLGEFFYQLPINRYIVILMILLIIGWWRILNC
jgi:hypothetical protein